MNWDGIKIRCVTAYKSRITELKNDRCLVEVEVPVEDYGDFRRMIEAHHVHNRRKDDIDETQGNQDRPG